MIKKASKSASSILPKISKLNLFLLLIQLFMTQNYFWFFLQLSAIDRPDFERLLKYLFRFNGNSYYLPRAKIQRLFDFYKDKSVISIWLDYFLNNFKKKKT